MGHSLKVSLPNKNNEGFLIQDISFDFESKSIVGIVGEHGW
jgi:ABC-type dipeptide/oligopeptide/nickel transport system ATPase component